MENLKFISSPDEVHEHIGFISDTEKSVFTDAWSSESVISHIDSPTGITTVAIADGTAVGYMLLSSVFDEGEILRIAVVEKMRKCGIGRKLAEEGLINLASRGASKVFLEVREDNLPAYALYSSIGFKTVSIRRGYYKNPICNAVIMSIRTGDFLHMHNISL